MCIAFDFTFPIFVSIEDYSDSMPPKLPVLFIGHGSPENAIEDNEFTRDWKVVAVVQKS